MYNTCQRDSHATKINLPLLRCATSQVPSPRDNSRKLLISSFLQEMSSETALKSNYKGATYDGNGNLHCVCGLTMESFPVKKENDNKGKTCMISCSLFPS